MGKIPKFDRREVDAGRMAFSGSVDDSDQIYHVGDEVTLVIKGKISGVAFKENQFGVMRRIHSIGIDHAIPADEVTAERIEREIKRRADEESGQQSLDNDIDGDGPEAADG